jgi:hypothetical protein
MSANQLARRLHYRRHGLFAVRMMGVVFIVLCAAVSRTQAAPPPVYEVSFRWFVFHQLVDPKAPPVAVVDAAEAHVATAASPRIAELAVQKFRIAELSSLKAIPRAEVSQAVSRSFTVTGRPSSEVGSMTILEVRLRSAGVNDGMTIMKAVHRAYEDFLDEDVSDIESKIGKRENDVKQLTGEVESLRRIGTSARFSEAERRLNEAKAELTILRLKRRVRIFQIVEELVDVKKVELQ